MLVLFPSDPFETTAPDAAWEPEIRKAQEAGHKIAYVHWEGVTEGNPERAVCHVRKRDNPTVALYRGWMLSVKEYTSLYLALRERNVFLLSTPEQYQEAHCFDGWYPKAESLTPYSCWALGADIDHAVRLVESIGKPCVIRDFVKSRKHEWEDACLISTPTPSAARRVIRNFVERQGDSFTGGIVVREYQPLYYLGKHPRSGTPMSLEYRIFWFDGEPAVTIPYWEDARYPTVLNHDHAKFLPPLDKFREVVSAIDNRFITTDVAMTDAGNWTIVEIGDGQVSHVIDLALADDLYKRLETKATRKIRPAPTISVGQDAPL